MRLCLDREILEEHAEALAHVAPHAEYVALEPDGRWSGDPDTADVALLSIGLTQNPATAQELPRMLGGRALRWVQSGGAGFDAPIFTALLERGVRLTNASGLHAEPIAQYIFTYILHWERSVAAHRKQQEARSWRVIVSDDLRAKTLGIVGLGGIGLAAARIGRAFGMRVIGLRRSAGPEPAVDHLYGPEGLSALLGESDYVVLALPLNEQTRGTMGRVEFAAMRTGGCLSMSRGAGSCRRRL